MAQITYTDKITGSTFTANDANEIKSAVNSKLDAALHGTLITEELKVLLTSTTIKDVFIYDTTKDSDGGAWRLRCQKLSWYNEPLNTATRGGTREFPAVALLVVSTGTAGSQRLYIYDATVTGCPLWMEFRGGISGLLGRLIGYSTAFLRGVSAKNGIICVSEERVDVGYVGGLIRVSLIGDKAFRFAHILSYYTDYPGLCGDWVTGIANRNNFGGYSGSTTETRVISDTNSDVAMTVLDAAPIDPITLLPVPTIAVATAAGVAVIDGPAGVGTRITSLSSSAFTGVSIRESGKHLLAGLFENSMIFRSLESLDDIEDDFEFYTYLNSGFAKNTYTQDLKGYEVGIDKAGVDALVRIKEDLVSPPDGMVSWISNAYNTGWMKGDIRRAFICDALGTTESLTNLVSNGTFDTDIADWLLLDSVLSWESGTLKNLNDGDRGRAYQIIPTVIGKRYRATADLVEISAGSAVLGWGPGGFGMNAATTISSPGTVAIEWTAIGTTSSVVVRNEDSTVGIYTRWDNITLTEMVVDRSVKVLPLTVTGTLTREPVATGAELQCITGFSSSNYLIQPTDANLAFGTGAFYMACWAKVSDAAYAYNRLIQLRAADKPSIEVRLNSGRLQLVTLDTDGAFVSCIAPTAIRANTWVFFLAQRVGTAHNVYVNGVFQEIQAGTAFDITNDTQSLYIGAEAVAGTKHIALIRIGAGSLTEAQIAEMYRTELPLFQVNAKCTLQGTSNDVKGLAYDERYNLLAATHGDKVTLFRDLEVEDVIDLDPATGVAVDINNQGLLIGTSADAQWENS